MSETRSNHFGGNPLNRLAWLRTSHSFLNAVIVSPATRWVLYNTGQPLLVVNPEGQSKQVLAYLTTKDVEPFIGVAPYFGQGKNQGELVSSEDASSFTESARHLNTPIVFLGLAEANAGLGGALPSSDFKDAQAAIANLEGTPYFALDIADLKRTPEEVEEILKKTGQDLGWSGPRVLMTDLDHFSAAVFAQGRSLVDWNQRNKSCPACGSRAYSMWGGWKLSCTSLLPWADNTGRTPCPAGQGLHNFSHPRTDPVVIMLAIDKSGEKILLGRGKRFPPNFYSALSGFIEPGETFEDAVKREMWEEAGVKVWDIRYHSGQPWPYPSTLMVGFYFHADATEPVRTDLDNELDDAKWVTREEILAVIGDPTRTKLGGTEFVSDGTKAPAAGAKPDELPFKLPPVTALAGVMIREWAEGKIGFPKA